MLEKLQRELKIYIDSRESIKKAKNDLNKISVDYLYAIPKKDIELWKQYSEYDKSIFKNDSRFGEWEDKMQAKKIQYMTKTKPILRTLTTFNDFKQNFRQGISLVNKDFISHNCIAKLSEKIKCYLGKKKILLEINNNRIFFFICIIERNDSVQYVTFEKIHVYNKSFIDEILNAKDEILIEKKFTFQRLDFEYNIYNRITKKKSQNKKIVQKDIENYALKTLILYNGLNKEIKTKIIKKNKGHENYYLINYEWIQKFQKCFNNSEINDIIQNENYYHSYYDYEKNIELLLKQLDYINYDNKLLEDLKNIQIIPNEQIFIQDFKHFTNFIVVNSKIYNLIKDIIKKFGLKDTFSLEFTFYFYPITFYHGKDFIEIGVFNNDSVFISIMF